MLDKIKLSLRISHTMLDEDIERNINACILDLKRVGINNTDFNNPLIFKAVELYCKWNYDFGNKGERYEKAYINLINSLSLCGDYNV